MDTDKTLVMLVGLPRSGKTTWAQAEAHPIVCPDAIRLALHGQAYISVAEPYVWAIAKTMVRALFLAGHNTVILDACNNTRKRRDDWISGMWRRAFHIFGAPVEICVERARKDDRPELIDVIIRMSDQHEPVGDDERDAG